MTLAVFIITFAHVSAQDIDVGGMDNAQLTELLLQIMQKLDQTEEPAETPKPTATPTPVPTNTPLPELSDDKAELEALLTAIMQKLQEEPEEPAAAPEIPAVAAAVSETEAEPAGDILSFTIYENKKLMIEKLPEYMFIQPTQPPKPDKPEKKDGSNNGGKKDRSPEDCEYHCAYEVCPWADNQCYFNCYYSCQNQPVPDWAKY
ncbi:MAG: hypothetical protein IJI07_01665 [Flexilinea sp.]|nr:hypothetical protein [Flexilinea sp.]